MAEKEVIESSNRKRIRQTPSVPFLWEEKPGIAKKDWRPGVSSVTPVLPPPVKLLASIPFNWEEKPGTPLPCFSQPPMEPAVLTPTLPLPLLYSEGHDNHKYDNNDGVEDNKLEGLFDLDFESFSFETDGSFSSAPSLLANCLVSSAAISTAVPVQKPLSTSDVNPQLETPSSPASQTNSSTSSYATGISSLVGDSFLECLFPLYPSSSGFLGKVASSKKDSLTALEPGSRILDHENHGSVVVRRPPTLGDLIRMSRIRSHQRKAVQMSKKNISTEFTIKKAFGCCIFGTGIRMIEGLQRKMHQPRLKLT